MLSSEYLYKFYRALEDGGCENHSLLIMRGNEIEYEHYIYPYSAEMPHTLFSVTKSLISTAVGFAIEEGLFGLDSKVSEFFPEFKIPNTPEWERITVKALLTMHSNKKFSYMQGMANDYIELFVRSPFREKGGFHYSNNDVQMLAEIVRRTSGENIDDFLYKRLFKPLRIEKPFWETDCRGTCVGGSGAYMTLRDVAKICRCYADNGVYEGKQVIQGTWTKEAVKTQITKHGTYGYGYLFWTKEDSFHMSGMMGQLVYYFPEYDAVIASFNNCLSDGFIHNAMREYLLKSFDGPKGAYDRTLEEYLKEKDLVVRRNFGDLSRIPVGSRYFLTPVSRLRANAFFPTGLIPKALSSSFAKQATDSMDNISFSLDGEDECRIVWYENSDRVEIRCGLDGKPRICEVTLHDYRFTVWAFAFLEKDTLTAYVKPINTLSTQVFTFRFKKRTMKLGAEGSPCFASFLVENIDSVSAIRKNRILKKAAPSLVRKAVELLEKPFTYRKK